MKPINFIKSGSAHKQNALRLWLLISTCSITTVLIAICIFQLQQFFTKQSLKAEKKQLSQHVQMYDTIVAQINAQQSEKAALQSKLGSFQQTKNPVDLLKHIKTTLKNSAQLESISVNEKQIEIKIAAENTTTLMKTTEDLSHYKSCNDLYVTSLEHTDKNRMIAVLRTQKTLS